MLRKTFIDKLAVEGLHYLSGGSNDYRERKGRTALNFRTNESGVREGETNEEPAPENDLHDPDYVCGITMPSE